MEPPENKMRFEKGENYERIQICDHRLRGNPCKTGRSTCKGSSSITIAKDGKAVDAKRIFGVMGLGVKCGEEITVCTDGENEEAASAAIEAFLKANL